MKKLTGDNLKKCASVLALCFTALCFFILGYFVSGGLEKDSFQISSDRQFTEKGLVYGKININTASLIELTDLPGIGPVLAGRIIEYREKHTKFTSTDQLLDISGIGEKVLERLIPYIILSEDTP